LHRLFPAGGEALACRASLKCHLDSALLRSVSLIETALQCETVAKNPRCQVPAWGLGGCRIRQTYSRRDVLGCSRDDREKNGSTTSNKKTVTTPTLIPRVLDDSPTFRSKKPHPASALGVRTKKRQEPLDKTGSFREVALTLSPFRQCHPPAHMRYAHPPHPTPEGLVGSRANHKMPVMGHQAVREKFHRRSRPSARTRSKASKSAAFGCRGYSENSRRRPTNRAQPAFSEQPIESI
jgi:hypothetical protein